MKKEVVLFKKVIQPGETKRFIERVKDNGNIEELRVRFYPGVERALQVEVFANHKVNQREDLLSFADDTERFISGDDDYLIYPVSVAVEYDDDIIVSVTNTGTYPYTLAVDVIIGYNAEGF